MPTYEEKLDAFAHGRRLLRLPRPIRDRADAFCDACGSTQPRTLYALKGLHSMRHFFVGDTCLRELAKRGVILKRFAKESGQAAYEPEMQLRAEETKECLDPEGDRDDISKAANEQGSLPEDGPSTVASEAQRVFPAVLMIQHPDHYGAFVSVPSAQGRNCSWAYAEEGRWEERWRRGGERGLVLERVREERSEAVSLCLARAWKEAHDHLQASKLVLPLVTSVDGVKHRQGLYDSLQVLLNLAAEGLDGNHAVPALRSGHLFTGA